MQSHLYSHYAMQHTRCVVSQRLLTLYLYMCNVVAVVASVTAVVMQ